MGDNMRKINYFSMLLTLLMVLIPFSSSFSASGQSSQTENDTSGVFDEYDDEYTTDAESISDPLEPYNRVMYKFNDKFYFWILKPTAKGYKKVVPERARTSVRNFLSNLSMPVRMVNCALQGKLWGSAVEITRFFVNTTWGVAGFFDPAKTYLGLPMYEEDFGQTLGKYGLGSGLFITWPFLGPSSLRDTVGLAADAFLSPLIYAGESGGLVYSAANPFEVVNNTSLTLGDYEDLKKAAVDPYISIRDAYFQNRESKVKE